MQALTCPKCGAPLQAGMRACPYCRVGLAGMPPGEAAEGQAQPPAAVPPGWTPYRDLWNGFTLAHPPGWEVITFQGQTSVRADPAGTTCAIIAPLTWPAPVTAQQLAQHYIDLAGRRLHHFQAWQQGNVSPDSNRVTIRMRGVHLGQALEGIFNVLVDGSSCIVSGYNAPPEQLPQSGPVLAQILSAFRTAERMPRQTVYEPRENAFSIQIPQGWLWQAGVDRNHIGGAGATKFNAGRDPQGSVMAAIPRYTWTFTDPRAAFFAFPTGYPGMPFLLASQFIPQVLVQQYRQMHPDLQIESVVERPDWTEYFQADLLRSGYPWGMFDVSVAILDATYTENGQRFREKSRASTLRQGGQPLWNAFMDITYRAPQSEFATWEPVLTGSLSSLQMNPQWEAAERALAQNYIHNAQADIHRRQQQISQTLSETSDILSNSYWNRQATYDRLAEMRSNATLGLQDVASAAGDVYKVPYGYDRYWADGLGNLYGGSWLSQPDIDWQPLEPTGI
jgi:hypothetical protein